MLNLLVMQRRSNFSTLPRKATSPDIWCQGGWEIKLSSSVLCLNVPVRPRLGQTAVCCPKSSLWTDLFCVQPVHPRFFSSPSWCRWTVLWWIVGSPLGWKASECRRKRTLPTTDQLTCFVSHRPLAFSFLVTSCWSLALTCWLVFISHRCYKPEFALYSPVLEVFLKTLQQN